MKEKYINRYIIKDFSSKNLFHLGFKRKDESLYTFIFPVLKYNNISSLNCIFTVDSTDGIVLVDVYDLKGNLYRPFYDDEYGNFSDILNIINKNISKQMKKFSISKLKQTKERKPNKK